MTLTKPYKDLEVTDEYIIREFDDNIDPIELMWHRDDEDRVVEVLDSGQGWKFGVKLKNSLLILSQKEKI